MAGFSTYQQIVAAQRAGNTQTYNFYRTSPLVPSGSYSWQSLWFGLAANEKPGGGATVPVPSGTTYTNDVSSMTFPNVSPQRKFITKIGAISTQPVTLMVYDRLAAAGQMEFDVGYTYTSPVWPRYADGAGVQAWVEVISGPGTASVRLTSYTNQDGVTGRAGSSLSLLQVSSPASTTMFGPLPLQAGDTGIRATAIVTGTSGPTTAQFSLVMLRPLLMIPLSANLWFERDLVLESMLLPEILDGASLCMAIQCGSAASATIQGQLEVTWG